jgi:transposase
MAELKRITVLESIKELRALQKGVSATVNKRLVMLIAIKRNSDQQSKRVLSVSIGVDANSITNWKKLYQEAGIEGILSDGRVGFKPSVVTPEEHEAIEKKLKDPTNGIRGYKELLAWVSAELSKDMKYITLLKYAERNFGSKIKVARKSHIKKDEKAVDAFKKTSVKSVRN